MASSASEKNPLRRPPPPGGNLPGKLLFSAYRLADVGLQYALLRDGGVLVANALGVPATVPGDYANLMLAMYAAAALRHAYWALAVHHNDLPVGMALGVGTFNTVFNSICSVVAVWLSPGGGVSLNNPTVWAGAAAFAFGLGFEVLAEEQRRHFKDDPRNKGRPFTKGLNGVVQHPNYFGYAVWRGAILLATGSVVAGAVGFLFNAAAFTGGSIPELKAHNLRKYGDEYKQYSQRTRLFIPFLW